MCAGRSNRRGEGGAPFIEQIRKILITDGKLLTGESTTQADLLSLNKLIFSTTDTVTLEQLWTNFCCKRSWPVLESYSAFEQIVRAGVQKGSWYVFRMGSEEKIKPEELYHQDNIVPLSVTLPAKGYSLITPQGAKQRGWTETDRVDPAKIRAGISRIIAQKGLSTVESIANEVVEQYGEVGTQEIQETVSSLVKEDRLYACQGSPEQEEKPDLISGAAAVLYTAQPDDVIITPAEAARRGWITAERPSLDLMGKEGAKKLLPLLGRLGSLYNKVAQSVIDYLELVDLCLPGGGLLTLRLEEVPPESMKTLDELFEVLDGLIDKEESAEAFLKITDPDEKCLLIRELQKE